MRKNKYKPIIDRQIKEHITLNHKAKGYLLNLSEKERYNPSFLIDEAIKSNSVIHMRYCIGLMFELLSFEQSVLMYINTLESVRYIFNDDIKDSEVSFYLDEKQRNILDKYILLLKQGYEDYYSDYSSFQEFAIKIIRFEVTFEKGKSQAQSMKEYEDIFDSGNGHKLHSITSNYFFKELNFSQAGGTTILCDYFSEYNMGNNLMYIKVLEQTKELLNAN